MCNTNSSKCCCRSCGINIIETPSWLLVPFPIIGQLKKILKDYYDRMYICEEQKWDLEREVRKRDWEVQNIQTSGTMWIVLFIIIMLEIMFIIRNYIPHIHVLRLWILLLYVLFLSFCVICVGVCCFLFVSPHLLISKWHKKIWTVRKLLYFYTVD